MQVMPMQGSLVQSEARFDSFLLKSPHLPKVLYTTRGGNSFEYCIAAIVGDYSAKSALPRTQTRVAHSRSGKLSASWIGECDGWLWWLGRLRSNSMDRRQQELD